MTLFIGMLVVLACGVAAFPYIQRSFFYPTPRNLPEVTSDDLETVLRRFESVMVKYAPQVLASLRPGLTNDEIAAIESEHRLRLTDELRALYRWRNGAPREIGSELIPGHRFVPLEEAADLREQKRRDLLRTPMIQRLLFEVFAGYRRGWLTVLDDSCGDGYFYDPARRRRAGNFFYNFAEVGEYRFFPALVNFIAGAIQCYESGVYRTVRGGPAQQDFERSSEVWEHFGSWQTP